MVNREWLALLLVCGAGARWTEVDGWMDGWMDSN